jgi:hypothetical protein
MPSSFYECAGTVSTLAKDPSALTCSAGWLSLSEPTFNLITGEQASDLIIAIVLLWGLVKTFSFIFSTFGVSK